MSVKGFQIDIADLEVGIDHDNIINGGGTNSHAQIDTHIGDSDIHTTAFSIVTATGAGSPAITHNVIATEDLILVDATAGDVIVQLQTLVTIRKRPLNIKRMDNTANVITVVGAGSPVETIDGATSATVVAQYDNLAIINGPTEWHIL